MLIDIVDPHIVAVLNQPAAFEPAITVEPMTGKRRGWRPTLALCRRMAKTRQVVIGMRVFGNSVSAEYSITQPRRDVP